MKKIVVGPTTNGGDGGYGFLSTDTDTDAVITTVFYNVSSTARKLYDDAVVNVVVNTKTRDGVERGGGETPVRGETKKKKCFKK